MDEIAIDILREINEKLANIDKRFEGITDWSVRFGAMETKISNLEKATRDLAEIKERVIKIETIISKGT